jgi:hypothetical protein
MSQLHRISIRPPRREESLCNSCRNAKIVRGHAASHEICACNEFHLEREIRFPVSECSAYDDKRRPALYHMERIAWILVTKKAGREAGFISAKELGVAGERRRG